MFPACKWRHPVVSHCNYTLNQQSSAAPSCYVCMSTPNTSALFQILCVHSNIVFWQQNRGSRHSTTDNQNPYETRVPSNQSSKGTLFQIYVGQTNFTSHTSLHPVQCVNNSIIIPVMWRFSIRGHADGHRGLRESVRRPGWTEELHSGSQTALLGGRRTGLWELWDSHEGHLQDEEVC